MGCYEYVNKDMVRVSSLGLGSMVTQISNSTPESVARMLLRELVRVAYKKSQMTGQGVP
jgi:hypothetical protein